MVERLCARCTQRPLQQAIVAGVAGTTTELLRTAPDFQAARQTLDRVPEYTARVKQLKKAMAATGQLIGAH